MKKCIATFLALSLALSLFCGASALASDFKKCGENLTWSVVDGVLTISGTGDMYDYSGDNPAPWSNVLREIIIEPGVTSIGDYAFEHIIGNLSFDEDPSTGEIIVTNHPIEKVSLPEGITRIGWRAFQGVYIKEIEIPGTVSEIGQEAFSAAQLEKVVFLGSPETIGVSAFANTNLKTIILPEGVKTIGDFAFSYCNDLTSITVPGTVVYIGREAFISWKDIDGDGVAEAYYPATLYVYENSCAHLYAIDNVIPFDIIKGYGLKGDSDGDGVITVSDALTALRIAAKLTDSTPEMLECCDIDGDGIITAADALAILRLAVGLSE